eukprot:4132171-Ditylum_brightwellii.AAC.1
MESNMICDVPKLGTFWFNKKGIKNIIALAHMTKKYCVTLDTKKEKTLIVHLRQQTVKFHQMSNGLYSMNPCHDEVNPTFVVQCLNTVEENMQYLSPRQLEQAKKA